MKKISCDIEEKKYQNVFWFLLDGLRPDFLNLGETGKKRNFIDQILLRGSVFTHVVTANAGTHTSMHSIFTSLLSSYNGAAGWCKNALRQINQEIFTIADYFRLSGYETFRYCDAFGERTVPMSGFNIWETSGYRIGRVLQNTNLTRTDRRRRFIEDVNRCKKNKFVYHHIELLHELNGESGTFWTSQQYAENVMMTAGEFERLFYEYEISEDDLVVIASDHGVILDRDYVKDDMENGDRQYEESVKAFFALIGKEIPAQCLTEPISSLDEAPTLCHLALGNLSIPGQGKDQYDYIFNGKYQDNIFFREKATWGGSHEIESPMESDLFYVRDGRWKYVYGVNDPRCEWLMDLETYGDYEVNLKEQYPEVAKKYHKILQEKYSGAKDFCYQPNIGFRKADIPKMFSVILQMEHVEVGTMESLLDMSGPYHELIALETETTLRFQNQYKVHLVNNLDRKSILEACHGEWLIYITENGEWSEYFLSDLYRYMQCHRNRNVKILGGHYTAVRKEESENFTGVTLYEEQQVRDIRFLHKERPDKKYILFGCGLIGKEAAEYFGAHNVACFVDNNAGMVGREVYGKRVISFAELQEIYGDYIIVITTKTEYARDISSQLEGTGIHDYLLFEEYERSRHDSCWESGYRVSKPEERNWQDQVEK